MFEVKKKDKIVLSLAREDLNRMSIWQLWLFSIALKILEKLGGDFT